MVLTSNKIKSLKLQKAAELIEVVIGAMPMLDDEEDATEYVSIEMQLRDIQEKLNTLAGEKK